MPLSRKYPVLALFWCALAAPFAGAADSAPEFHISSLYHVGFWVRDIAKSRAFYHGYLGYDEPYELHRANGDLQMVVMKVNERQVIYLFVDASKIKPNGDNLDHLGLETDHIEALRTHLLAKGVKVGKVNRGHIGDLILGVKDPDGHIYEITQLEPQGQLMQHQGKSLATGRVSNHLMSASLAVADLPAALKFYENVLGFREVSRDGGIDGKPVTAIRLRVPDGEDLIELLPNDRQPAPRSERLVPRYTLAVDNLAATTEVLAQRAKAGGFPEFKAKLGGAEISCLDPDGTEVVLAPR